MHEHNTPSLFTITQFARQHRKAPTRSEALLWRWLCQRQLGVRVRRQHVLYPYIVDFYVASHRLVIEIDGGVHASPRAHELDASRTLELTRLYGVRVLRIDARLVECSVDAALAIIRAALA
jgi:very-short-patch-repair endonuclease